MKKRNETFEKLMDFKGPRDNLPPFIFGGIFIVALIVLTAWLTFELHARFYWHRKPPVPLPAPAVARMAVAE